MTGNLEKKAGIVTDSLNLLVDIAQEIYLLVQSNIIEGVSVSRIYSLLQDGTMAWTLFFTALGAIATVLALAYAFWRDWHNKGIVTTKLASWNSSDLSSRFFVRVIAGIVIGGIVGLVVGTFFGGLFKVIYEVIEPPFLLGVIEAAPYQLGDWPYLGAIGGMVDGVIIGGLITGFRTEDVVSCLIIPTAIVMLCNAPFGAVVGGNIGGFFAAIGGAIVTMIVSAIAVLITGSILEVH